MTLADLLVSCAVLGLTLGATVTVLVAGQQAYAIGEARVESQQNARVALERLAAEVRVAGRGADAGAFSAIAVAEPTRIVLQHDLDGNGVIAGAGETVTWLLAGTVLRRDAGGGAQPVVNGVIALALEYFDGDGQPTATPADVRAVSLALTTRPEHARAQIARGLGPTVATTVRLRNR